MNYLVVDLECTCNNPQFDRSEMETIEIGAIILNDKLETVGLYQAFIKPTIHTELTDFCKQLTSITQYQVDTGSSLDESLKDLYTFASERGEFKFVSWGGFDFRQIKRECKAKGIDNPFFNVPSINYKERYTELTGNKGTSITKALHANGLDFSGTQHRGIDDAINIVALINEVGI